MACFWAYSSVHDNETSLYYLQSRYYDPQLGRFINPDVLVSTGQGILGNNTFAYCGNNPIVRIDPTGKKWMEPLWEHIRDTLINEKEKAAANKDETTSTGLTASAAFGIGASTSLGVTKDTKGNVGLALTLNGGGGFPSVGVGIYKSKNNAPTIYHQQGWGAVVGASGGPVAIAGGGEYNMMIDQDNNCAYHGATASVTYGFYPTIVEVHGELGYTWVWGVNVYDVAIAFAEFMGGL